MASHYQPHEPYRDARNDLTADLELLREIDRMYVGTLLDHVPEELIKSVRTVVETAVEESMKRYLVAAKSAGLP